MWSLREALIGFRERPGDARWFGSRFLETIFAASDWMGTNVTFPRILIRTYKYELNISTILEMKCYFNNSLEEL